MRPAPAIALGVLLTTTLIAALAPFLQVGDPNALAMDDRLSGPSAEHPAGTDLLGRDQLSRLAWGGRLALLMSFGSVAVSVVAGTLIATVTGTCGVRVRAGFSALVTTIQAVPDLMLSLAIVALLGPGPVGLIIALSVTGWASYARLLTPEVMRARTEAYVDAARVVGCSPARLVSHHLVPNIVRPILALASLQLAGKILTISSLSFLGVGIQPPTPDWGTMVADARTFVWSAPHLLLGPGLCIVVVAMSASALADSLLDS
jgi:peptide/nickel transport system permease protein